MKREQGEGVERLERNPLLRILGNGRAWTASDASDPRLRGRTYGIPFQQVWEEALQLVAAHPRWTILRSDDEEGVIEAVAETVVFRFVDDVRIRITLDEDGQTRVDLTSESRRGLTDFKTNTRRIGRFLHDLDQALEREPVRPHAPLSR